MNQVAESLERIMRKPLAERAAEFDQLSEELRVELERGDSEA